MNRSKTSHRSLLTLVGFWWFLLMTQLVTIGNCSTRQFFSEHKDAKKSPFFSQCARRMGTEHVTFDRVNGGVQRVTQNEFLKHDEFIRRWESSWANSACGKFHTLFCFEKSFWTITVKSCCFKLTEKTVHYRNVLCLKTSKARTCLEH